MNLQQIARMPNDIDCRLGPKVMPGAEPVITPAPAFMVEALTGAILQVGDVVRLVVNTDVSEGDVVYTVHRDRSDRATSVTREPTCFHCGGNRLVRVGSKNGAVTCPTCEGTGVRTLSFTVRGLPVDHPANPNPGQVAVYWPRKATVRQNDGLGTLATHGVPVICVPDPNGNPTLSVGVGYHTEDDAKKSVVSTEVYLHGAWPAVAVAVEQAAETQVCRNLFKAQIYEMRDREGILACNSFMKKWGVAKVCDVPAASVAAMSNELTKLGYTGE